MARRGRKVRELDSLSWSGWPHLIASVICLFSGVLIGFAAAYWGEFSDELRDQLWAYFFSCAGGDMCLSFTAVLWECVRWQFLSIILGFSVLGVIGIPCLLLVRGFLLSYAVTCFSVLFGLNGLLVSGVLQLASVVFILPPFLALCCEGLRSACNQLPGVVSGGGCGFRAKIILPCVVLSVISATLQWTAMPKILTVVCARLINLN